MTAVYCPEQHHFYRELGVYMRTARKAIDLSTEQLAYDTEVSRTTIAGVERGNYKISAYLLLRIFKRLGISSCALDDIMLMAKARADAVAKRTERQELHG
jgi:transcriptional regulator with XRE-family HTH domain